MFITDHNHPNGSIFGNLDKLEEGDIITLVTKDDEYSYEVYDTEVIKPYDLEALMLQKPAKQIQLPNFKSTVKYLDALGKKLAELPGYRESVTITVESPKRNNEIVR